MATPRDIRRLAFQTLYQLDARPGDAETIKVSLDNADDFTAGERAKAFALAEAAHAQRSKCDRELEVLAPTWPARRQAAVDRAILRLAHYEIVSGVTPAKVAVNEAVELAKSFSTDKSPSFINGLLDKVLKRVLAERAPEPAPAAPADPSAADPSVADAISADPTAANFNAADSNTDPTIETPPITPIVQPRSGDQNVARGASPG
jgi:N utilization substance protein B